VTPNSFTIARALRTKARVICARSKENGSVFGYFLTSARAQKAKLAVDFLAFPSVKFRKIWQIGSKYFTSVGARFSGKSIRPDFFTAVKDINLKKSKKLRLQTLLFSCLKSRWRRCVVKILEDFTEENSRKPQIKPHKQ